MIKNIQLKFGSHPDSEKLSIETTPVTVFVGPNNSGKSKLLSEIQHFCGQGDNNFFTNNLVDDITLFELTEEQQGIEIKKNTLKPNQYEQIQYGNVLFGNGQVRNQLPESFLKQFFASPNSQKQNFCQFYLSYRTVKLDALSRITLINQQPLGDLQTYLAASSLKSRAGLGVGSAYVLRKTRLLPCKF